MSKFKAIVKIIILIWKNPYLYNNYKLVFELKNFLDGIVKGQTNFAELSDITKEDGSKLVLWCRLEVEERSKK